MTNKTPNVSVVTKEKVTTINDVPKALADENRKLKEFLGKKELELDLLQDLFKKNT